MSYPNNEFDEPSVRDKLPPKLLRQTKEFKEFNARLQMLNKLMLETISLIGEMLHNDYSVGLNLDGEAMFVYKEDKD